MTPVDDPYYMTPDEEAHAEWRVAQDRIALLEGQLEDAQMKIADLEADLRAASTCEQSSEPACVEVDGCPTELAVLQRYWRATPREPGVLPCWKSPAEQWHRLQLPPHGCVGCEVEHLTGIIADQHEQILELRGRVALNGRALPICGCRYAEGECHGAEAAREAGHQCKAEQDTRPAPLIGGCQRCLRTFEECECACTCPLHGFADPNCPKHAVSEICNETESHT